MIKARTENLSKWIFDAAITAYTDNSVPVTALMFKVAGLLLGHNKQHLGNTDFSFIGEGTMALESPSIGAIITLAFNDNDPDADTITDSGDGFLTAGFLAGDIITISGSASNNKSVTIDTVTAGLITLITSDTLTDELVGSSVTITATDEARPTITVDTSDYKGITAGQYVAIITNSTTKTNYEIDSLTTSVLTLTSDVVEAAGDFLIVIGSEASIKNLLVSDIYQILTNSHIYEVIEI